MVIMFLLALAEISSSYCQQKVGLVLSGGGAKGAVHIGIIKALEENDIPIDYIAGTSAGAIVGSFYASGYSPDEILELFLSDEFYYWQTGKVENNYRFFFRKRHDQPDVLKVAVPLKDSVKIDAILPNSLINPIQLNQAFMSLYAPVTARCGGDFDKLFVPFLCIASDLYHKRPIIFRSGDLGDAVRASMTFPMIFKPIERNGVPLYDGGIFDNFPIKPMKNAWHPDVIIGSAAVGNNKREKQALYDQMENIIMLSTEYAVPAEDGILLSFNSEDVGLLDFQKAKELRDIGYEATIQKLDSIKSRVQRRVSAEEVRAKREAYKASLPPLIFNNITVTGISEAQKNYVESQIHRDHEGDFTINDFKRTYFRLLTNSKIKEILPHAVYNPKTQRFDLTLNIITDDAIEVAFGGNISSMSANQVYLGLGYQSLAEVAAGYNLDLQLGNACNGASLETRVELPTAIPLDLTTTFTYNYRSFYESKKLFIDTDIAPFIRQSETYGKLSLGLPFQNQAKMDISVGYGYLEDQYYQSSNISYTGKTFDKSSYKLFNGGIFYTKNTLDSKQFPIAGQIHEIFAQCVYGNEEFLPALNRTTEKHTQAYIKTNVYFNNYYALNRNFNLGYVFETVLSSKNLLNNYTASVLRAPAFTPTPHSKLVFNEAFRANQYIAAGLTPIWKINPTFHLRGDFDYFLPIFPFVRGENDKAKYGDPFTKPAYLCEINLVARLPFLSINLFTNYYSYPQNNWNFGLNIGYLIFGQKFIQ